MDDFIIWSYFCSVCAQIRNWNFIWILNITILSGVQTGIYTTNTPEACEHVINDSKSQIVVVENKDQLRKILKIKHNCKYLKSIVQYTGDVEDSHNGLVISVIMFLL